MSRNGHVRGRECEDWQLGLDCTFDERSFYVITAGLWLFTALPLVAKAFLPCGKAPTGKAKWCLLATAASSVFLSIDASLVLLTGQRKHIFLAIGTIFLGFGLRWFGWLWWKVAGALGNDATHSLKPMRDLVKVSYDSVAFLNVPVALVFAVSGTEVGLRFGLTWGDGHTLWFLWCLLSACVVFTLNSILM